MTTATPLYTGRTGEVSAIHRPSSMPPGYITAAGTRGHFLASPDAPSPRFSLYRWDMSATSGGPGPHFHRTYDETFIVISGVVRLYDGSQWFDAPAGDMLHLPAGGIHGFTNASGAPASEPFGTSHLGATADKTDGSIAAQLRANANSADQHRRTGPTAAVPTADSPAATRRGFRGPTGDRRKAMALRTLIDSAARMP